MTEHPAELIDWPTVLAISLFWIVTVGLVVGHEHVPTALLVVGSAILGGFYTSLQHEVIHGHPTPWPLLNRLFVVIPLGLLQPFSRYSDTHLTHHRSDLTDPVTDPESYYVLPDTWAHANSAKQVLLSANRTLAARLTIGPLLAAWKMISFDVRAAAKDPRVVAAWAIHVFACAALLVVIDLTGLPIWLYLLGFVYGGAVLTSLRSFVEHRAFDNAPRSAVVHSNWFFGLLYLNNNLHYTHHQLPGAAWYRLPELTETLEADAVVAGGAGSYPGYASIFRRYLFRPFDQPVSPLSAKMGV